MNPNPIVFLVVAILAICAAFVTCSGPSRTVSMPTPNVPGSRALLKVEGPFVDRLSSDQIERIEKTCLQFHNLDDARVPYTRAYCERVSTERDLRSLRTHGSAPVHAQLESLH